MAVTYSQNGTIVRQIAPTTAAISRRIDSEQGILVVDNDGNIGAVITDYFPHSGNTYYNNFAIVVNNADFSQSGLGQVTFLTPGTTDIGGRTYRTVNIGGVEWLAENLDYKFSGCDIGATGYPTTPAAWYYNNDEATYGIDGTRKCGLLYNWYAVKLLNDSKATLCPGWHVPTATEWDNLFTAVGGSSTAATVLKAVDNSASSGFPSGWNGTDDYGFGILPAGNNSYDKFRDIGSGATFVTSTENGSTQAYGRSCGSGASMSTAYCQKTGGYSLRLVRDAT